MAIIDQLGLNISFVFQFGIAVAAFFILSTLIFKPYLQAFEARENQTKGSEELALDLKKESTELKSQYETQARTVASKVKEIFDSNRAQGAQEAEKIVKNAKDKAAAALATSKKEVEDQVQKAMRDLDVEVPKVAQSLKSKVVEGH